MNHGLMTGMFWGGVLLSAIPVLAGIGMGVYIARTWRTERAQLRANATQGGAGAAPSGQ